jgi:hypothetical protein
MDLLQLCVKRASTAVSRMRFSLSNPTERHSVILLLALIDHGRSILALLIAKEYPGIPIIGRAAVEGYVDLVNLCDNRRYWMHLEADEVTRWTEYEQLARTGANRNLQPIVRFPRIDELRRYYARRRQELGRLDIGVLSIAAKFERAGLREMYDSYYALLCSETHNGAPNLLSRYVAMDQDTMRARAPGERNRSQHHYEAPVALTTSEIIVRATERVLQLCGHGTAAMHEARERLDHVSRLCLTEEELRAGQTGDPADAESAGF